MMDEQNARAPSITKEEAEEILSEEMNTKEFWVVDVVQDNFEILQDVLDLLFNTKQGNSYSANYCEYANVTKLNIYCRVCCKELASFDPFITHDKGKAHKKALATLFTHSNTFEEDDVIFKDPTSNPSLFHARSLESILNNSKHPVLGVHFVYKEEHKGRYLFTCHLCKRTKNVFRIYEKEMYIHITSDYHLLKYMTVVHNTTAFKVVDVMSKVHEVMEKEGKIAYDITTLKYDHNYTNPYKKRSYFEPLETFSPRKVTTADKSSQTDFERPFFSDLLLNLRNCVEEEQEIGSHLRDFELRHEDFLIKSAKTLSHALLDFSGSLDTQLKRKVETFIELMNF